MIFHDMIDFFYGTTCTWEKKIVHPHEYQFPHLLASSDTFLTNYTTKPKCMILIIPIDSHTKKKIMVHTYGITMLSPRAHSHRHLFYFGRLNICVTNSTCVSLLHKKKMMVHTHGITDIKFHGYQFPWLLVSFDTIRTISTDSGVFWQTTPTSDDSWYSRSYDTTHTQKKQKLHTRRYQYPHL